MKRRLCVFVVDDDPDYCKGAGLLVKSFGHEAETFFEPEALLEALATRVPDVILADIGMPRINGCDLARSIRDREDCRHVVLAAVTGHSAEEDRRQAAAAGFDFRFVKPLAATELRDFLEHVQTNAP
jgi:CheY-like chemotaxis protein